MSLAFGILILWKIKETLKSEAVGAKGGRREGEGGGRGRGRDGEGEGTGKGARKRGDMIQQIRLLWQPLKIWHQKLQQRLQGLLADTPSLSTVAQVHFLILLPLRDTQI